MSVWVQRVQSLPCEELADSSLCLKLYEILDLSSFMNKLPFLGLSKHYQSSLIHGVLFPRFYVHHMKHNKSKHPHVHGNIDSDDGDE